VRDKFTNLEVIDLTDEGESVEELAAGDTECPICMHCAVGGVRYCCCAQFCCLACFRRMHCGASARFLECPFCRKDVAVHMDLLQLHWGCGDGTRGSLWVYPGDPLCRLAGLLALAPTWSAGRTLRVGAVQVAHTRQVVLLDETPLYMSALVHGDRLNVLFEYEGMLMY
jgi:hypothetical protein